MVEAEGPADTLQGAIVITDRSERLPASRNAREFAVEAHGHQRYNDSPYVEHLAAVVRVLEEFGFCGDYVVAGWLHDVVEDTATTTDDVRAAFGERVGDLVWAVTGGGDRDAHVRSIYEKIAAYPDAAVVKLADRIANVEASKRGDRHSQRYSREHPGFAKAIEPFVPGAMWRRYLEGLQDRSEILTR